MGDNFCDFLFGFLYNKSVETGYNLKGKNLLPRGANSLGSKFFPFRGDHFSEGRQNQPDRVTAPKSVLITLSYTKCMTEQGMTLYTY